MVTAFNNYSIASCDMFDTISITNVKGNVPALKNFPPYSLHFIHNNKLSLGPVTYSEAYNALINLNMRLHLMRSRV